ncbi:hypothetical protein NLI96_g6364 [Meripilus lineatus]|uniref:Mitochondrial carrier n=1 Tax=Meripilus lineatus TaxID=2056292 RepID=A0AAD5V124_9APHY|nr:hypothetical protein NLI96_g6364 [Physisporinus lineatus]
MTSTLPPLVQAFSGAIGSATANTLSYPLDLIATRLQTTSSRKLRGFRGIVLTLKHILQTEGWHGLYDGLGTDTLATLLSNFLYFYFYSFLRTLFARRRIGTRTGMKNTKPVLLSMPEEIGIGFLAGVASRAITTPLSVVTVRLQTATEDDNEDDEFREEERNPELAVSTVSTLQVIHDIYLEDGIKGLWRGFSTAVPLSLSPAITLFLFQIYRRLTTRGNHTPLATPSPRSAFLGAAFSNTIATILLYPLILAKTRLQVHRQHARNGEDRDPGPYLIWKRIIAARGWRGFYQGLEAQILKGFVNQGVAMMVKQRKAALSLNILSQGSNFDFL